MIGGNRQTVEEKVTERRKERGDGEEREKGQKGREGGGAEGGGAREGKRRT